MALTLRDWQDIVFWEVSGRLPGGPESADQQRLLLTQSLREQLPLLWQAAAVKAAPFAGTGWFIGLNYLYCRRAAVVVMLGQLSHKVDGMLGRVLRLSESQKFKNMQSLLAETDKEIQETLAKTRYAAPMSAAMIQTAPVMVGQVAPAPLSPTQPLPPDSGGTPDANDPAYAGDPYVDSDPNPGGW
jgi:hypothetical protein